MGLFDGWPFKTREQEDKEKRDFEKRVFPFGPEQKDAAEAVLKEGITGKLKNQEKLFAFICAKDACMLNGGEEEDGLEKAQEALKKQKWVSAEDRKFIYTFMRLEIRATSLEDYPTVEQVRQQLAYAEDV